MDLNMGRPRNRQARYQLRYYGIHETVLFNKAYQVIVKKMENKIVYYKETIECQHVIFWLVSQASVHCHIAKLEPNRRVTADEVPCKIRFNIIFASTFRSSVSVVSFLQACQAKSTEFSCATCESHSRPMSSSAVTVALICVG
jgi:hypothetical protein